MLDQSHVIRQLRQAMDEYGLALAPNNSLIPDGDFHRCDAIRRGKSGTNDGYYVAHVNDNYAAGGFGDYGRPDQGFQYWKYERPGWQPTSNERAEIRQQAEELRAKHAKLKAEKQAATAVEACERWDQAEDAVDDHQYCIAKKVKPYHLRQEHWKGTSPLLVPMRDNEQGEIVNLHFIHEDGHKHVIAGGRVTECHFWVEHPDDTNSKIICICEGWAEAESIYAACKHAVLVSFGAANLRAAALWARELFPDYTIIICADDDWKVDGNPGLTKATEAARAVGGLLAVPKFGPDRGDKDSDFNDMMVARGLDAVADAIDAAATPDEDEEADEADGADDAEQKKQEKQTDQLIQLAAGADLFHSADGDGEGHADIQVDAHRETWPIRSKGFQRWLLRGYFRNTKSAPAANAMSSALAVLEAKALYDGPERELHLRVARHDGKIYLNLADKDWQVVEIDKTDWRIISDAPVRFIRRRGMQALPVPTRGGSIKTLRGYLNLAGKSDFVLLISWLLAAMYDRPYPVLAVVGEQGTAKSTLLRTVRRLIDPNKAELRSLPRSTHDLFIAATSSHVLAFDNLSDLPDWISDALASLATGGSFGTRQYYTDDEERLFAAMRAIMLGSIEDVVSKGDLAERMIRLRLIPISDDKRRLDREYWETFERDRPTILGALLDGVVHGLRELPHVQLDSSPRMADFAEWGNACEGAYWGEGTFEKAYAANRGSVMGDVIEADMVASAVHKMMTRKDAPSEWAGTATELLYELEEMLGEKETARKGWPGSASALSGRLQRAAAPLRRLGIETTRVREGKRRERTVTITRVEKEKGRATPSAPSAPSAKTESPPHKPFKDKGLFKADEADAADGDLQHTTLADNGSRHHRFYRNPSQRLHDVQTKRAQRATKRRDYGDRDEE